MSMQGKKIPDDIWDKFLEMLQENFGCISHVCSILKIERRSYYNKCLRDPKFAYKAQEVFERVQVPLAEEMLRADVIQRKAWAIKFTLERSSKKWSNKFTNEHLDDLEYRMLYLEDEINRKNHPLEYKDREPLSPPKKIFYNIDSNPDILDLDDYLKKHR